MSNAFDWMLAPGSRQDPYSAQVTAQQNQQLNNSIAASQQNVRDVTNYAQNQTDLHNAAVQSQGPSSGYGQVGGYPTFGGAQEDLTGRSSFSGVPLNSGSGGSSVFDTGTTPYQDYGALFSGQSLTPTQQAYSQSYGERYGQSLPADYFSGGGWDRDYGNLTGAVASNNNSGGSSVFDTGTNPYALSDAQQRYADQYRDKYGKNVDMSYFSGGGFDRDYPGSSANQGRNDLAQTISNGVNPFDDQLLTPGQRDYTEQYANRYGTPLASDYFSSGQWDRDYGSSTSTDISSQSRVPARLAHVPLDTNIMPVQSLADERRPFAERIRDDPNLALRLAARLNTEEQSDPQTRIAMLEAMLNRMYSTGADPLALNYFPQTPDGIAAYNRGMERVSNDNALYNTILQEMETVFGGSNYSRYATDWASDQPNDRSAVTNSRQYATPTWTSGSRDSEEFFRKDTDRGPNGQSWAGPGISAQNRAWYSRHTGPPPAP